VRRAVVGALQRIVAADDNRRVARAALARAGRSVPAEVARARAVTVAASVA
jgi:hypothetical protein